MVVRAVGAKGSLLDSVPESGPLSSFRIDHNLSTSYLMFCAQHANLLRIPAAEAAHKGPLFTPSLLNLLQGSPLGFWNSFPHVEEADKRERSVDGERTPKI